MSKIQNVIESVKSIDEQIAALLKQRQQVLSDAELYDISQTGTPISFSEVRTIQFIEYNSESVDYKDASESSIAYAVETDTSAFRIELQVSSNKGGTIAHLVYPSMDLQSQAILYEGVVNFVEKDKTLAEEWDTEFLRNQLMSAVINIYDKIHGVSLGSVRKGQ